MSIKNLKMMMMNVAEFYRTRTAVKDARGLVVVSQGDGLLEMAIGELVDDHGCDLEAILEMLDNLVMWQLAIKLNYVKMMDGPEASNIDFDNFDTFCDLITG